MDAALAFAPFAVAVLLAALSRGQARRFFLMFALGIIAMRVFVTYAPYDWRFLGSCAVWVSVGSEAIRRGLNRSGVLLIACGLCYAGQEVTRLPPVFGNPWLVAADLLGWLALAGIYRGRMVGISDKIVSLGHRSVRGSSVACDRVSMAKATRRKEIA